MGQESSPVARAAVGSGRLFLAMATGQTVSNMPPILHAARPGDEVIWLWNDSDALAAAEATTGVLRRRGVLATALELPMPDFIGDMPAWWALVVDRPPLGGQWWHEADVSRAAAGRRPRGL
jgi:hypothetical protein